MGLSTDYNTDFQFLWGLWMEMPVLYAVQDGHTTSALVPSQSTRYEDMIPVMQEEVPVIIAPVTLDYFQYGHRVPN